MSSEFIAALIGAVVGGLFTLLGSYLAVSYAEHRTQVKAEQGRMFEAFRLLSQLKHAMYPVRWYDDGEGENPHYVDDEEFASYAEWRHTTTRDNIATLRSMAMSITKNVDLAHDLYFLDNSASEEHLDALTERARLSSNPALVRKIVAVERKRAANLASQRQGQES